MISTVEQFISTTIGQKCVERSVFCLHPSLGSLLPEFWVLPFLLASQGHGSTLMQVFFLTWPNPTILEQVLVAAANVQNCIFSLAWEMHWKSLLNIPFYLLPCSYACVWSFLLILSSPHIDLKIYFFACPQICLAALGFPSCGWSNYCYGICFVLLTLGLHLLLVNLPRHCS